MDWIEISVAADGEAAEAVSELFNRLNARPDGQGGAVTEIGGFDPVGEDHRLTMTIKTYVMADDANAAETQRQLEEGLWHLGRLYPLGEPSVRRLAEEDWANAWKANYRPLQVGRFLIIPSWQRETVSPAPGIMPIVLDPGMAFGTGLHPSTQLCLLGMDGAVQRGCRVLDAGCGSGILSIGAARLEAAQVDAFDNDPIAVRATEENAAFNDLAIPIRVVTSAGPQAAEPLWAPHNGVRPSWDVILVNILPHVITALLDRGLAEYLAPAGRMILAGIIEEREAGLCSDLAARGLRVVRRLVQGDWVSLTIENDQSRVAD